LVLISVVPDSYPPATDNVNSDGLLKPCPFCGNPNVSLVETCLKMVTKICTSLTVAVATLPSCLTANSEPSMTGTSVTWRAAVEINAFVPAGSVELAHQQALTWVCDAYLFHLVSLHRRPVYRHQYGDISQSASITGFIDSYLEDKGWIWKNAVPITSTFWTLSNICIEQFGLHRLGNGAITNTSRAALDECLFFKTGRNG
jgi:hypothetical protein